MPIFAGFEINSQKKTRRNSKASSDEVQQERKDFWQLILQEKLENLAFLDEMGILTGIMRDMARSLAGTRAYDFDCVYRGTRLNYVGAMSVNRILCLKLLPKSMNGELFKEFVQNDLAPNLWKGAVVVMDNLKAHKVQGVREMIEAAGAKIIYLPRYSPDFNPIEHFWWELKAFVRRFKPKTPDSIQKLLELGVLLNSAQTRQNYFTHCCYCTI